MAISLASISKTRHATPPRILIYGPEKVGKSTFFAGGTVNGVVHASAPKPIFIRTEDGLNGLDVDAFPLSETYQSVIEALSALASETHDFKTVVIDSADWLERLIHQRVIDTCHADVRGTKTMESAHGGYGKAYGIALTYWREVLSGLDYLNRQKGMIVGVICHATIAAYNDPMAEPYDVFSTKLHKPNKGTGARDLLSEWADVIGFAQRETFVSRKTTADGKQIARGSTPIGATNKLNLVGSAGFVAGNRYSLPETIPLSWQSFSDALSAAFPAPVAVAATVATPETTTKAAKQAAGA